MHNTDIQALSGTWDIQALSGTWSNDPVVYGQRGPGTA